MLLALLVFAAGSTITTASTDTEVAVVDTPNAIRLAVGRSTRDTTHTTRITTTTTTSTIDRALPSRHHACCTVWWKNSTDTGCRVCGCGGCVGVGVWVWDTHLPGTQQ